MVSKLNYFGGTSKQHLGETSVAKSNWGDLPIISKNALESVGEIYRDYDCTRFHGKFTTNDEAQTLVISWKITLY